jgi:hypothetical protein
MKLFFLAFLLSQAAFGAKHSWKTDSFFMDVPANWQSMNDFFGVPVTFLDPSKKGSPRATIQVIPTEARTLKLDELELAAFNRSYPERKKAWASKKNAVIHSITPATYVDLNKNKTLMASTAFLLDEVSFIEKTYFLNCGQKLYQLKLLAPAGDDGRLKTAENVLRSFKCAQ